MPQLRRLLLSKKIALAAVFFLSGCATSRGEGAGAAGSFVVVVDGRVAYDGPAAYTVREGGVVESVVGVKGVGEVIVKDGSCRFVRADRGLAALQILESRGGCGEQRGERLCFDRVSFGGGVVVDGCADRNELFLDRAGAGADDAGLGPRTLIERCVPVPVSAPRFVRVDDIRVNDVDASLFAPGRSALRFRWNGDGFDVCFPSRKSGAYRLRVTVDDAALELAGDVAGL